MGVYSSLEAAGTIKSLGSSTVPAGYLLCDGTAVLRSAYPRLFAAIGESYGNGDGSTTFNLPDGRGQFVRGVSLGSGVDPDAGSRVALYGGATGDNVGSYQGDVFGFHAHSYTVTLNTGGPFLFGAGGFPFNNVGSGTGGAGGNETRPKNLNATMIVKY